MARAAGGVVQGLPHVHVLNQTPPLRRPAEAGRRRARRERAGRQDARRVVLVVRARRDVVDGVQASYSHASMTTAAPRAAATATRRRSPGSPGSSSCPRLAVGGVAHAAGGLRNRARDGATGGVGVRRAVARRVGVVAAVARDLDGAHDLAGAGVEGLVASSTPADQLTSPLRASASSGSRRRR